MSEATYSIDRQGHDLTICEVCGHAGPGDYILDTTEIPDGSTTILAVDRVRCASCAGPEPSLDDSYRMTYIHRVRPGSGQ